MYDDATPETTWAALADDPRAVLVDVRTEAEWMFVGTPDLTSLGKRPVLVEWQRTDGTPNPAFVEQLEAAGVPRDAPVYFLCRSGGRSAAAAAAATAAGFGPAHNVVHGFEGPPDAERHRGRVAGWKVAGLPWVQA